MKRRTLETSMTVACPFCGDVGEVPIDEGGGMLQTYVEDCPTCCKPRSVRFDAHGDEPYLSASRE
jgi:endogenous inhibitor of DNA gyrase (YacG/DUF329 family)